MVTKEKPTKRQGRPPSLSPHKQRVSVYLTDEDYGRLCMMTEIEGFPTKAQLARKVLSDFLRGKMDYYGSD